MPADDHGESHAVAEGKSVRVFVTYTHDSKHHKQLVRRFAEFLRSKGVDANLDQWDCDVRRDWYAWMIDQVNSADYVAVIASPEYKRVGDGGPPAVDRRGAHSEAALLRELLHSRRDTWILKLLPVVLPGRSVDEIPLFLQPETADHYLVDGFTTKGAEALLRTLLEVPVHIRTELGSSASTIAELKGSPPDSDPATQPVEELLSAESSTGVETPGAGGSGPSPDFPDPVAAHSRNEAGHWHTLADHARSTGELAAGFAESWGASQLARALGLFHDAGKASAQWQRRLREVEGTGRPVGRHEDLGARLLKKTAGPAAMAVLGHHSGLDSVKALKKVLRPSGKPDEEATVERFFAEVPEAHDVMAGGSLVPSAWSEDPLLFEMGLRMTFSALVDADRLDTAAHSAGKKPVGESLVDMAALVRRFERGRADLLKQRDPSPMDAVRQEVYEAAVAGSQQSPGLYRLAAPAGSGKTLAQGGFALHHAERWGKRRVVVAMPLVTVTEQNAQVYRDLLDGEEPVVLEHHSQVKVDESEGTDHEEWARLAAENWDAPFVLTTTVQLFETLLGRSPSQVRKLHRLANSVLVLDEVQALPPRMLLPILDALRLLVKHFGTTVLLTSATQPTFEDLSVWRDLNLQPRELIKDVAGLFERARRVVYEWRLDPRPTLAEVAAEVAELDQCLVIVNSTKDARRLYRALSEKRENVWHLSSRMYPQHRARVLDEVTSRLKAGQPVTLVATQLVEAGVDISFPVVWRAIAPADSLQQSAGRAGRHGGPGSGRVVVFDPADGHAPPEYKVRVAITRSYFGPGLANPDNATALDSYYKELYSTLGLDRTNVRNARGLNAGQTIQQNRKKLDFRAVVEGPATDVGHHAGKPDRTKAFRMIEQNTVPVVIVDANDSAAEDVRGKLKQLEEREAYPTEVMRGLQGWIVTLPVWTVKAESTRERLERLGGDLHLWLGPYDAAVGIDDDPVVTDTTG
ncbi:CRISPR-associated helicase Cas3' [Saccharopolyspora sp. NPDC002376]